ncbi:helix-turn-helix transcriptional regulator [Nocardia abscessus]|uniref:helix-turn-helix domain-containing protein n=1 Tax=Nocardia TaxID=1817 RepID=UPI0018949AFA|nr:helix-turn-helix transcriptional regulator [Nocardia abscessus]
MGDCRLISGKRLRAARQAAGMSLAELAARIPFSRSYLGHVETGTRVASADVVAAYLRACGEMTCDPVTLVSVLGKRMSTGGRSCVRPSTARRCPLQRWRRSRHGPVGPSRRHGARRYVGSSCCPRNYGRFPAPGRSQGRRNRPDRCSGVPEYRCRVLAAVAVR